MLFSDSYELEKVQMYIVELLNRMPKTIP